MKKLMFIFTTFVLAACAVTAGNTESSEKPQEGKRHHRMKPSYRFQKAHGMWTAFAELSEEQRQAMLKLQREDPEKFRTEMRKLAEKSFKAERARRQELADLVKEYNNSTDKKVKDQILEKIKSRVKENFKRRLRLSRLHLDELQKRVEKLEKELDRREKAEEQIVDATVQNIISGKRPKFGPSNGMSRRGFPVKQEKAPLKAE